MIQVRQVRKTYGSLTALDNISFRLAPGTELTIMGPSGSGKTTLVNLIAGLDSPDAGHILVNGLDITELSGEQLAGYRREQVGIIFQQFHLIEYLTALENVMLAQYFHSMPDVRDARQALEQVGLGDRADHLPSQLSGGEQQRVAVARAITNDPALILADEPTGNLDAENERVILDIFDEFKREGKSIITVTHNATVAETGDQILRLDHGRIVEDSAHRVPRRTADPIFG